LLNLPSQLVWNHSIIALNRHSTTGWSAACMCERHDATQSSSRICTKSHLLTDLLLNDVRCYTNNAKDEAEASLAERLEAIALSKSYLDAKSDSLLDCWYDLVEQEVSHAMSQWLPPVSSRDHIRCGDQHPSIERDPQYLAYPTYSIDSESPGMNKSSELIVYYIRQY